MTKAPATGKSSGHFNYEELPLNFRIACEEKLYTKYTGKTVTGKDQEEYYEHLRRLNDSHPDKTIIDAERRAVSEVAYYKWNKDSTTDKIIEEMHIGSHFCKIKPNSISPEKIAAGNGQSSIQR